MSHLGMILHPFSRKLLAIGAGCHQAEISRYIHGKTSPSGPRQTALAYAVSYLRLGREPSKDEREAVFQELVAAVEADAGKKSA